MTPSESLMIVRMVRAICPQQKFDEYTPDAWHRLLDDLTFADCETAVIELGRRQTFISPSEIRTEVRRARNARIADTVEDVPDADPDDVKAYLAALRDGRTRTADGGTDRSDELTQLLAPIQAHTTVPA